MLKDLNIARFASINNPINLSFGRNNLILGANATGKTAICDAISCLFEYKTIFSGPRARFSGDYARLQASNILLNKGEVKVEREIKLSDKKVIEDNLRINGKDTNDFNALSSILKVVYVDDRLLEQIDNDRKLAKYCLSHLTGWSGGLSKQHFLSLNAFAKQFNSMPNKMVEAIEWQSTGRIRIKNWHQKFWLPTFNNLSGSERCILLTEIAILLGQLFSAYRPTLILLDSVLTHLDKEGIRRVSDRINSIVNPNLQFISTTWREEADRILEPDCTIKIEKHKKVSHVSDFSRRTPKGILHAEQAIKNYGSGDEDKFINSVVVPMLCNMGFSAVKRIQHHGPGELGLDIGPFTGAGFEWRSSLCGAQAKCSKVNAKSGDRNNVNVLIDEVKKALHNNFYDPSIAMQSKLDYVLVMLSQHPTTEALKTFYDAFQGDRRVILLDPMRIAELTWKYGVTFY